MSGRVTQRELAAAAGVSLATVSRVYSDHPKTSAATKARVRELGARLGYRPTPGLSAAMSARWRRASSARQSSLAMIRTRDAAQRHYADAVLRGNEGLFARQARELGYEVEAVSLESRRGDTLRQHLEFLRVDGIVVPMVPCLDPEEQEILTAWPCVGMMTQQLDVGMPVVSPDELMSGRRVFEELVRQGYRRTGIILTPYEPSRGVIARLGGLLAARELHPSVERVPVLRCPSANVQEMVDHLLKHRCDSVIVEDAARWQRIEKAWVAAQPDSRLGRAALIVSEEDHETPGIRNDPRLYHDRVLRLLDTMVRGSITGAQLSDLRETVGFEWQSGVVHER